MNLDAANTGLITDTSMSANTTEYRYYQLVGVSGTSPNGSTFNEFEFKTTGSNDWTLNGGMTAANNQMLDTPTNNFATWNPLASNGGKATNGNLSVNNNANNPGAILGSLSMTTGKWYWEITSAGNDIIAGIFKTSDSLASVGTYGSWAFADYEFYNGKKRIGLNGVPTVYDGSGGLSPGEVVGLALDCDIGTLSVYRNGVNK